ncbi:AbrB/MazE/SpoVT family DNA-binding domain-containing protein [Rubrivirga sp.]|uniref:AbrB/MazE/SpoVT family DNA-binding domain-containing protein n=1 Tax=Rubrivirga sp. TaxID=1885344 RepID=UPI003B526237
MAQPQTSPSTESATHTVTFRKIGNSIGATFPKEIVEAAGIDEKSTWHVVQTADGLLLKKYDGDFEEAWAAYQGIKRQYGNVFRELAK